MVTIHCTEHTLGSRRIIIGNGDEIYAKLARGCHVTVPLNPGLVELVAYRNKKDVSRINVDVDENTDQFVWVDYDGDLSISITPFKKGERIPDEKSAKGYEKMRSTLIPVSILGFVGCAFAIVWSLHLLNVL